MTHPATGTGTGAGEWVIDWRCKSFPPAADGLTAAAFVDARPGLGDFSTPVVVLDEQALAHNLAAMRRFCAQRGVVHAPHGKTTMSPELIVRQLAHGVWGMTAATAWQARALITMGARRVIVANECLDPGGLVWLVERTREDPGVEVYVFADSITAVQQMQTIVAGVDGARALPVLVEVGVTGGRAGARTVNGAVEVGEAVAAAAGLELAGVGGFEGVIGATRDPATTAGVREFGARIGTVADELANRRVFRTTGPVVLSAGGSMFFDIVADELNRARDQLATDTDLDADVKVVIRPGCCLTHDHGIYHTNTPLPGPGGLRPAMRVWSRVLSTPEPHLVIIDAGKRDIGTDAAPPPVLRRRRGGHDQPCDTGTVMVDHFNDQHGFLHVTRRGLLEVGDLVELGVSHPCTTFDKWRAIPVIDEEEQVVDIVRTVF